MARLSTAARALLFNCCEDHAEPDWKPFTQLEIAGCRDENEGEGGDGETCIEGLQPAATAEFFTIYGRFRQPDGTCEAITDAKDARDILAIAGELALRSGLPVIVHPSLSGL